MDTREKEIAFLDAELVECQGKLQHELLAIGAAVIEASAAPAADPDLARKVEELRSLRVRVEQARDLISQVQTRADRIAAIDAVVKGNDQRVKEAMKEVEHRYAEIGGVAWTVYRDQCAEKDRFREVFQPVLTLEEDLQKHHKEVERLEQEGQKHGFFAKVLDKSKILLVEAKLRYRESDRAAALEETGRRVCASRFPESVHDPAFGDLMGKIDTHRKKAIEVQEETAQLRVEQARLEEELRTLGVMAEAGTRVKELQREIDAAEKQTQECLRGLGALVCERKPPEVAGAEAIARRLATVDEVRRMIAGKSARIDQLKSAMDLDKVGDEMSALQKQKAQLETQVREAQAKLAAVDAEIARVVQRTEDLRRRAGEEAGTAPPPPAPAAEDAARP